MRNLDNITKSEKQDIEPQIIFENENFLIINKPAGLIVHADGRSTGKTLCDFLVSWYPQISEVGEPLKIKKENEIIEIINRPGIVHRLDKETSGVMVVAKNQQTFLYFKKQFKNRKIEKTYHAFVYGNIKEDEFEINEPIGRSKKDFRRWFAGEKARGKKRPAQTSFKVLSRSENKTVTFVGAKPKTGRTHQIRVHLNHVYKPIIGDKLYAPDRESMLGFERLALHARKIEFTDLEGKRVEYEAEYPADFAEALENFK